MSFMNYVSDTGQEEIENCLYMFGSMVLSHGMPIQQEDIDLCMEQLDRIIFNEIP